MNYNNGTEVIEKSHINRYLPYTRQNTSQTGIYPVYKTNVLIKQQQSISFYQHYDEWSNIKKTFDLKPQKVILFG